MLTQIEDDGTIRHILKKFKHDRDAYTTGSSAWFLKTAYDPRETSLHCST
jgi:hypothetical protein